MARQTLEIVRKYTADTTGWQRALQNIDRSSAKTAKSMRNVETSIDRVGKSMRLLGNLAKGFAFGFAGAFSVQSLRSVTQFADELNNTADRVGVSVEAIQALRFEAEKVGLSFSATDTALQRFSRRIAEARQDSGVLAKVFEQYGVTLNDVEGNQKSVNTLLEEFRRVLSGIEDPAERNRVAMAAFDTEGVKLGQTLGNLNGTIAETTEELARQGRVIRQEAITAAAELETRFTETAQRLQTVWRNAVVNVVQFIDTLVARFRGLDDLGRGTTTYQLDVDISEVQRKIQQVTTEITNLSSDSGGGFVGFFQRTFGSDNALEEARKALAKYRDELESLILRRNQLAASAPAVSDVAPVSLPEIPDVTGGGSLSGQASEVEQWADTVVQSLKLTSAQAARFRSQAEAFTAAAQKFGVDRNLLVALAKQESGFNKVARSTKGAIGVMQLMPGTARDIARQTGISFERLVNDASANIEGGAFYIAKRLKQLGGDVELALAAYNAGIGNVQKFGGVPPFAETQGYVKNIIPDYERLSAATGNLAFVSDDAAQAIQRQGQVLNEIQQVYQSTRTPAEQYAATLERLRGLLDSGLDQETFVRAAQQAQAAYFAASEGALQAVEATNTLAQSVGQNLTVSFGSWIDRAVEGTFKLKDALRGLAADIAKLALRFALFGSGGGGGLLGGVLGGLFGFAKGAAFSSLPLPQGVYAQPTYFTMPSEGPLKRYAQGGVLGEAGPEAVLPLKRGADGKLGVQGGGTEVVINNYSGEDVSRRTRQLGDREIIEIAIGQMDDRIQRGGNSTARALDQAYKLRRGR